MRIDIMGDGLWWLDENTLKIHTMPEGVSREMELLRLTQSAEVLDTIIHEDNARGPDQDRKTLSLLRGLNRILRPQEGRPQEGMCSGGVPGTLSEREIKRRVKQFVAGRSDVP
jgi:hypothetical protein